MGIYDTMKYVLPDIATICFGMAAVTGSCPHDGRHKGNAFCTTNAEIMIHQPLGGAMWPGYQGHQDSGRVGMQKTKEKLIYFLEATGQPYDFTGY